MQTRVNISGASLLVAILGSAACASFPQANERSTNVSEELNPIARLNRHLVTSVTIEPIVVNGAWVELRGDGNDIVLRSTGPAGNLRPKGSCVVEGKGASAFVAILARAKESGAAGTPVTGDYLVRINTTEGGELTARVPVSVHPNQAQVVVIGDRQYRLDVGDLEMVRRLIADARC